MSVSLNKQQRITLLKGHIKQNKLRIKTLKRLIREYANNNYLDFQRDLEKELRSKHNSILDDKRNLAFISKIKPEKVLFT